MRGGVTPTQEGGSERGKLVLSPSLRSSSGLPLVQICVHVPPWVQPHPTTGSGQRGAVGVPPPSSITSSFLPHRPPLWYVVRGVSFHHTGHLFPKDNPESVGDCLLVVLSKINTAAPASGDLQGQQ